MAGNRGIGREVEFSVRPFVFTVPRGWALTILIVAILLIASFAIWEEQRPLAIFVAAIGATVGALFAVINGSAVRHEQAESARALQDSIDRYAEWQIANAEEQRKVSKELPRAIDDLTMWQRDRGDRQWELAKLYEAYRFIRMWNEPAASDRKKAFIECLKGLEGKKSTQEVVKHVSDNPEYRHAVMDTLNFYEMLAIAIRKDVADGETLKDFFRTIIHRSWTYLYQFVDDRRNEAGQPRNEKLFREVELLHDEWMK